MSVECRVANDELRLFSRKCVITISEICVYVFGGAGGVNESETRGRKVANFVSFIVLCSSDQKCFCMIKFAPSQVIVLRFRVEFIDYRISL